MKVLLVLGFVLSGLGALVFAGSLMAAGIQYRIEEDGGSVSAFAYDLASFGMYAGLWAALAGLVFLAVAGLAAAGLAITRRVRRRAAMTAGND